MLEYEILLHSAAPHNTITITILIDGQNWDLHHGRFHEYANINIKMQNNMQAKRACWLILSAYHLDYQCIDGCAIYPK